MSRPWRHLRGSVLIVTLWITVALTGLVLTLAFSMRTEAMAAANRIAQAQAEAAVRGMEQWMLNVVDLELSTPGTVQDTDMEARQIGECYAWANRPDFNNTGMQVFGMTDEAGKLDLNTATSDMLMMLPGMTEDVADAIVDWRDADSTVSGQGAEDDYYMSLPEPYHCKNGPFESIDELLLVKGVTRELLYGYDRNHNGIIDNQEATSGNAGDAFNAASDTGVGIAPFVTVYGIQATTAAASTSSTGSGTSGSSSTGTIVNVNTQIAAGATTSPLQTLLTNSLSSSRAQQIVEATRTALATRQFANVFDYYFRVNLTVDEFTKIYSQITAASAATSQPTALIAKVNINTAPREVLLCLPGLTDTDADAIISHRQGDTSMTNTDPVNIAWLAGIIDAGKAASMGGLVTGTSKVFSADIVAISPDGRALRRSRVVVSGQQTPARIVYRCDLSQYGWPLPDDIRKQIRSGFGYEAPLSGGVSK